MSKFWTILTLVLMIFYDLTLHIVEFFDIVWIHPIYPIFPLMGEISYNLFWMTYWATAFIISLSLLFKRKKKNE